MSFRSPSAGISSSLMLAVPRVATVTGEVERGGGRFAGLSFRKGGGLVNAPDARIVRKKGKYPFRA
jgi:hypothetical protein